MTAALGPRHSEVRRLRELLRDAQARNTERAFVVEGPRAVDAALDRDVELEAAYLGPGAEQSFAPLVARLRAAHVRIEELKDGVLERVGSTVTPQPVLAVAPMPRHDAVVLRAAGLVLVAVEVADPGNVGTLLRSAEAAGAVAILLSAGSVDAYNPKVVRASAGAIFGVPLLDEGPDGKGWSVMDALDVLRDAGRACLGTRAADGRRYDTVDLTAPVAVLLGNEARGLDAGLDDRLDGWLTIPMAGATESLNVAMAGTVLCFEAARQRAAAAGAGHEQSS
ncbi:MAG TPA: RNA methyltransferase [Acidimicrobiia bacterium]|nr:RNA methyltransferase [Acidimicrobiia bacterium]